MKILEHEFDPKSGAETVLAEDAHGRQLRVTVYVLQARCPSCARAYPGDAPDAEKIIQAALARHELDEKLLAAHQAGFEGRKLVRS